MPGSGDQVFERGSRSHGFGRGAGLRKDADKVWVGAALEVSREYPGFDTAPLQCNIVFEVDQIRAKVVTFMTDCSGDHVSCQADGETGPVKDNAVDELSDELGLGVDA